MILKTISVYRTAKVRIRASQQRKLDSVMHNNHCIIIIAGDHKGHKGHIKRRVGSFVLISGLFRIKQTKKETIKQYSKIHVSNVMHYSTKHDLASRVCVKIVDGRKQYFYSKNQEPIEIFTPEKTTKSTANSTESEESSTESTDSNEDKTPSTDATTKSEEQPEDSKVKQESSTNKEETEADDKTDKQ